ncbi:MAG: penicillin-insensitive murein endopeptidase [Bacteroidetes bacterium]|nr:penicillin-insensitive murein endopeptidase [Bacteroidota bacterium]
MNKLLILLIIISTSCSTLPKGTGNSISEGTVSNGQLKNGRRFPYKGKNFKYFSPFSFAIFNRAWVHAKVLDITLEVYKEFEESCPNIKFLIMECSKRKGGRMWPHRTHQNGTSIDFGTPLLKKEKPYNFHHSYGVFHYTMKFDENGVLKGNKNIKIDFETMAKHILALEKAARKRKMYIKKVIFKIDLKDNFFRTESGKLVKKKKIYFARKLPKVIDNVHDDHYHIDFGYL